MSVIQAKKFAKKLANLTSQDPSLCYQCGKCSAGCPLRDFMPDPPNRIVRFVQLGMIENALRSETIWKCAGCLTCSERCPKQFDLAGFMDALREISLDEKIPTANEKISAFHTSFLNQIKKYGRSYELGLIMEYKFRSGEVLKDASLAHGMLKRGKLAFFPSKITAINELKDIYRKIDAEKTD